MRIESYRDFTEKMRELIPPEHSTFIFDDEAGHVGHQTNNVFK